MNARRVFGRKLLRVRGESMVADQWSGPLGAGLRELPATKEFRTISLCDVLRCVLR